MSLMTKSDWRHFALIVLFASVVRAGVLFATQESLSADPDAYRSIAICLAQQGTFGLIGIDPEIGANVATPTAFRPPLYPWLISWLVTADGKLANLPVAVLHWWLGVLTVAATYLVAKWMAVKDSGVAVIAAGLVAIDPLLLQSSSLVMTETVAALLVVVTLWSWLRLLAAIQGPDLPRSTLVVCAVQLGIVCGAGYLCRPTFILWPLLLAIYLAILGLFRRHYRSFLASVVLLTVVLLFVAAWTARNVSQFGKPVWATTHGGYTLLLGNNPSIYEFLQTPGPFGQAWDAQFFIDRWACRLDADPRDAAFWDPAGTISPLASRAATIGEVADDRLAYETAVATIQRNPATFFHACWWRLGRLHSALPLRNPAVQRDDDRPTFAIMGITVFYGISLLLILRGLWKLGGELLTPRWAASIALWVALTSVHTFYWTDMRMRAPAAPVLSMLAALGAVPRSRNPPNLVDIKV